MNDKEQDMKQQKDNGMSVDWWTHLPFFDCDGEDEYRTALRESASLDEALLARRDTATLEGIIHESKGHVAATLARTTRIFELLAPERLLEMSPESLAILRSAAHRIQGQYMALPSMHRNALAGLAAVFRRLRQTIRNGLPRSIAVARMAIGSADLPKWVFFDEETALLCLEKIPGVLGNGLAFPRELFATLLLGDRATPGMKAAIFRRVFPNAVTIAAGDGKGDGTIPIFGVGVRSPKGIFGLPASHQRFGSYGRADYALAVNERLQRAFADTTFIRSLYVAGQLPGHELVAMSLPALHHARQYRSRSAAVKKVVDLANESNPAYFKLMMDLNGLAIDSDGAVIELVRAGKFASLAYMVRHHLESFQGCLTAEQLLFHASTIADWRGAAMLAAAVEKAAPGTTSGAVDEFGNTPIWYTLYNPRWDNKYERERYIATLSALGCKKDRRNHLGLSFAQIWG